MSRFIQSWNIWRINAAFFIFVASRTTSARRIYCQFIQFWFMQFSAPLLRVYTFQFPLLLQHFIFIWQLSSRRCVNSFPSDLWSDERSLQRSPGAAGKRRWHPLEAADLLCFWAAFPSTSDDHLSLCRAPWETDKQRWALIFLLLISWRHGSQDWMENQPRFLFS